MRCRLFLTMNCSASTKVSRMRNVLLCVVWLFAAGCVAGRLHDLPKLFQVPESEQRLMPTESGAVCRVQPVRVVDQSQYDLDRKLGDIVKEKRENGWIYYITSEYTELDSSESTKQPGVWTYNRYKVKVQ